MRIDHFNPYGLREEEEQIDKVHNKSIDHLKSRVSYCFAGDKNPVADWGLSTWATRLSRSSTEKNGTAGDKAKLPPLANRNKPKGSAKRVRKESNSPLYYNRQQKRKKKAGNTAPAATAVNAVNTNNGNEFARVFGHVALSAEQQRELAEVAANAQRRAEARRQETGDAAGTDGDRIFVNRGTAAHMQIRPNHGQTSSIERQQLWNTVSYSWLSKFNDASSWLP